MKKRRVSRWLAVGLCAVCAAVIAAGAFFSGTSAERPVYTPGEKTSVADLADAVQTRGGYFIKAAVAYDEADNDGSWQDTMAYLDQSLLVNLEAEALPVKTGGELLDSYDALYLDESLLDAEVMSSFCDNVMSFAENGGSVMLPNGFCEVFPKAWMGISETRKLEAYPDNPDFPELRSDASDLQEILRDYCELSPSFADFPELAGKDYGYAFRTDGAEALCLQDGLALCAVHHPGKGTVLLSSALLPNTFAQAAFSMEERDGQLPFCPTTASCNQLFYNEFASLTAKQRYGAAMTRVFGCYGSPSMSWELHYEDISAIANNSMKLFSERCEEAGQIPSFSLVRNTYQWFTQQETAAYALNEGKKGAPAFSLDRYESAYSSGTHIDSGGEWLHGGAYNDAASYFQSHPEENLRYYTRVTDYDGDGCADLFCGSEDGRVYYYRGLGFTGTDGRMKTEAPVSLEGVDGGHFAAPEFLDVDGDGTKDLLVGNDAGRIDWYRGLGGLRFDPQGTLLEPFENGQCLPAAGDLDGDGTEDLLVGSDQGKLLCYYGKKTEDGLRFDDPDAETFTALCAAGVSGNWYSPAVTDYDEDGSRDILVGTFDGYIARLAGNGSGEYRFDGFITVEDINYQGNGNLKFGTYCSPCFYDLDGDGKRDLLCGYEEYGLGYPIDSDYFPYRDTLQEQIDYMRGHRYYLGVHFLTGPYASEERERQELAMHRDAFASYGVDMEGLGVNQHTWYVSGVSPTQTMEVIADAGLRWQSGFSPANSTTRTPQVSAENVISLPFYFLREGNPALLIQDVSVLGYAEEDWTDRSAKYGMPMCAYYHCDKLYEGGAAEEQAARTMETLSRFQKKHGYNFVREDQMMFATAAAYNLSLDVKADGGGLKIRPAKKESGGLLYDKDYQKACGVRLDPAAGMTEPIASDAAVWKRDGDDLLFGLGKTVRLYSGEPTDEKTHLTQVNVPAEIDAGEDGVSVKFLDDGMMQAVVSGPAATEDEGWETVSWGDGTRFTKFGAEETLHITYQE